MRGGNTFKDFKRCIKQSGILFNANSGLKQFRNELKRLDNGENNIINVCLLGDSITEGTRSGTTPAEYLLYSYPALLRSYFSVKYGNVGRGFLSTSFTLSDGLIWQETGTWIVNPVYGVGGYSRQTSEYNSTSSLIFNGTGIIVAFTTRSSSGQCSVTIDGNIVDNLNLYSATTKYVSLHTYDGLEDEDHIITITKTDDNTKDIVLLGACEIKGNHGIRVHMMGHSGDRASNGALAQSRALTIDPWNPALTVIGFMTNEYATTTPVSTMISHVQTIISNAKIYGDVLVMAVGPRSVTANPTPESDYARELKKIAQKNNCAYLSIFEWWGSYANANAQGFINSSDHVHPTPLGYISMSQQIIKALEY